MKYTHRIYFKDQTTVDITQEQADKITPALTGEEYVRFISVRGQVYSADLIRKIIKK